MMKVFEIKTDYKKRERQMLNALLALATAVLTLIYPNFLYLIAGGYLVGLGVLFIAFRMSSILSAIPVVTGILIFIFPELIPVTFAVFLGLFGLILLFSFQLSVLGILTLVIAVLIIMNPDSIAYLVAVFLLLYSVNNLIYYFRRSQSG